MVISSDPRNPTEEVFAPAWWVRILFFMSLVVLLNTPVAITIMTNIDQYSYYVAEDPFIRDYSIALTIGTNFALAICAGAFYLLLWELGKQFLNPRWMPIAHNALMLAIPILIGVGPSLVLCPTFLKPYFLIVGIVMLGFFSASGAWTNPTVELDHRTAVDMMRDIVIVIAVLIASISGPLCNLPAEQPRPVGNILWEYGAHVSHVDDDEESRRTFSQNFNNGTRIFIVLSMLFGGIVLGIAAIYTISANRSMTKVSRSERLDPDEIEFEDQVARWHQSKVPTIDGRYRPPIGIITLLFVSLLLALNAPVPLAVETGVDQYALSVIGIAQVENNHWAIATVLNISFAILAIFTFILISGKGIIGLANQQDPLPKISIAIAFAVSVAMLPSVVLAYTALKVYLMIIGVLIWLALTSVASMTASPETIAATRAKSRLMIAVAGVALSATSAVVLLLYALPLEQLPPSGNLLTNWEHVLDWPADFDDRQQRGLTLFKLIAIPHVILFVLVPFLFVALSHTRWATNGRNS